MLNSKSRRLEQKKSQILYPGFFGHGDFLLEKSDLEVAMLGFFLCLPTKKKTAHPLFQAYLKEAHDWQAEDSTSFTALHVAHVLCALNKLKRSGLREPDVDAHVEILQTLADNYLVQGKMIPAKLLRLGTLKHPFQPLKKKEVEWKREDGNIP